jgi:ribosomal-protein-alanine N-acetyltransferase
MEAHLPSAQTARLRLEPLAPSDSGDLFSVYSDPRTWVHLPSGRLTRVEQARERVERSARDVERHGLGMWAVRVRAEGADATLQAGTFIGSGGVGYAAEAEVWNLGYRLDPAAWGRGFASEIARAAVAAAADVTPQVPVTARVLSNNPASVAVLEKIGLTLVWEGQRAGAVPERDGADPPTRRIYADRDLTPAAMRWLVDHA